MKKFIIMAILAAVVVMSLGCISAPEKKENASRFQEKMPGKISTLRIGYQPSTHQIAEMVASEKGWWAEDLKPFGITEIKEFEFPTGVPEMQAMVAGELDIAYVGTAPPISAISAGLARQDRGCGQHQRLKSGPQAGSGLQWTGISGRPCPSAHSRPDRFRIQS